MVLVLLFIACADINFVVGAFCVFVIVGVGVVVGGGAQWEISPILVPIGENNNMVDYLFFHTISLAEG